MSTGLEAGSLESDPTWDERPDSDAMAGGHKINPLILRTPATATSNRPGADVWRRTDGGSRRRRRTVHVALLLESGRPPHISLDSEAVLPGMGQLSPCPLSCLPPSQLPFHLPRCCQTTLDMREALASPASPAPPLTPASQALSALAPLAPHSQELAPQAPVARRHC